METSHLTDRELQQIEREHPDGLTSRQIVDLFESRGERFSEATFRKYVQLGLLPRSVRVGRKGKHRGSCGLYPATIVRRVQAVKRMMAEGHTIEDIQRSFVRFKDEIEALERGLRSLFTGFERELKGPQFDAVSRRSLALAFVAAAAAPAASLHIRARSVRCPRPGGRPGRQPRMARSDRPARRAHRSRRCGGARSRDPPGPRR